MNPQQKYPLILCGCPGSGTSLFAKMLRHCGLFLGADAGSIDDRKFHESVTFRKINQAWLDQLIQFPHAPKGAHQFQELARLIPTKGKSLVSALDLNSLLAEFWGSNPSRAPWGWKDPRNSATAAIWKRLFPAATIVVLERHWRDSFLQEDSHSPAGSWFRQQSTAEVRQWYHNPVLIPDTDVIRVDFDRLTADPAELNQLLDRIGLDAHRISDFDRFKRQVGVET